MKHSKLRFSSKSHIHTLLMALEMYLDLEFFTGKNDRNLPSHIAQLQFIFDMIRQDSVSVSRASFSGLDTSYDLQAQLLAEVFTPCNFHWKQ